MQFDYLLRPLRVEGGLQLPNRIVFDDVTRCRVDMPARTPMPIMAEYYAQRATVGLLLTEPTMVATGHSARYFEPGLFTDAQQGAWAVVARAVHEKNGRIFAVLDHGGRCCHSINDGSAPVGPVAAAAAGSIPAHFNRTHQAIPFEVPRAATDADVEAVTSAFVDAARRAVDAGLDGVEVVASHGHLFHQFIDATTNTRTDKFGGDVVGRCRALLVTVNAIGRAIDPQRVGVRLDPYPIAASPPAGAVETILQHVGAELQKMGVSYLHLVHGPRTRGAVIDARRSPFRGAIVASGPDLTLGMAEAAIASRRVDAVALGSLIGANPDLVERLKTDAPLNAMREAFAYSRGAEGYVDYPTLDEDS